MTRSLATAFVAGAIASFGLVGCGEESKNETTEKVTSPGGTTEKVSSEKVKSSGSNPPMTSDGKTAETPK